MTVRTRRIYLDHNATSPLLSEAKAAMLGALELVGNPSSVHEEGRKARAAVEEARGAVARLVAGKAAGTVFTSGATEAANACLSPDWIIEGVPACVEDVAVCDADHPATREGGRFDEAGVTRLPVDAAGRLDLAALEAWLGARSSRRSRNADAASAWDMLCLTLANSETGVIQDTGPIVERLRGRNVLFVLDASQAAGRMPLSMADLGADALLLSGHKLGAPKGVGAYVLADEHRRPAPLLRGGGQEKGRRAGTEALPLIAGFGAAAGVAAERLPTDGATLAVRRDRLVSALAAGGAVFRVVGEEAPRLVNTLSVAAPGLRAETAQIALDLEGFAVSSGSACSSGKVGPSHVLKAMCDGGLAIDASAGAIRVSIGYETTDIDIDAFAAAFLRILAQGQRTGEGRKAA